MNGVLESLQWNPNTVQVELLKGKTKQHTGDENLTPKSFILALRQQKQEQATPEQVQGQFPWWDGWYF